MPRCIYCGQDKPIGGFNREHVINAAFGGFEGALTLVSPYDPGVCADCNTEFSSTIDLAITRDSMEAMLRLDVGLKSPAEVANLFRQRVRFRLPSDNEMGLGPLYLDMVPSDDGTEYRVVPVPQVRFRTANDEFKSLTEEMLKGKDPRLDPDIDLSRKRDLFWPSHDEDAPSRLISLLERYDIAFKPGNPFVPPPNQEMDFETLAFADKYIARAVAKTAMNYLAKTSGESDQSFVHDSMFDPVRRFIRYGEGRGGQFVQVWQMPTSIVGLTEAGAFNGHLLHVKWEKGAGEHILAFVRLFGVIEYVVRLAKNPTAPWRDLSIAHEYDLVSMKVRRLKRG
ncbi:MAG TPA: HNH endonuclease [Gemmatimonadaceae bacterium]|nr:HNH endonuclease [Gemmatimonadaceae bacterium]